MADSPFTQMAPIAEYRFRIEFWAILGCIALVIALVELVRRHRLKERYSFLWFLTAGVLLAYEAGATVTDIDGRPWTLGSDSLLAAATAELHADLLALRVSA